MSQKVITRAALDRVASIGDLYDIRVESFVCDSLLRTKVSTDDIEHTDLGSATIELVQSDSLEEKLNKFGIEGELKLSILGGLLRGTGSMSYLTDTKKSARSQRMSLIYKIRTAHEKFTVRRHQDNVDQRVLISAQKGDLTATHTVVALEWGATCCITCEYDNKDNKDETSAKGAVSGQLEALKWLISTSASGKVDAQGTDKEKEVKFTFKCTSDVSSSDDIPTTFEGALTLARSIPSLVRKQNNGKGVPQSYTMMPLDAVAKICKPEIVLEIVFESVKEETITKASQTFEMMRKKSQRLYDIQRDLQDTGNYVPDNTLDAVDDYAGHISAETATFRSTLQEMITKIRRRETEVSELDHLAIEAPRQASFAKYEERLTEFQSDLNRVSESQDWNKRGIVYLGKKDQFVPSAASITYVFYKPKAKTDEMVKVQEFFLQWQKLSTHSEGTMFAVVDEKIRPDLWQPEHTEPRIAVYENGTNTCDDLYTKENNEAGLCLIKHHEPMYCQNYPRERTKVKIRCPSSISGHGQCPCISKTWQCRKCKETVEFGLETEKFYCKCGEATPTESVYRCNVKEHGLMYIQYPSDILRSELVTLQELVKSKCTNKFVYYEDNQLCLIVNSRTKPFRHTAPGKAWLYVRCPKSFGWHGQCKGHPATWTCIKCREVVQYRPEALTLHCQCGEFVPASTGFRCDEGVHGIDYVQYPDEYLRDELLPQGEMKELNVLVLGETGAGKSTFIHSISNYLGFADLTEALNTQNYSGLIPSAISYGKDRQSSRHSTPGRGIDNEVLHTGNVATQDVQAYMVQAGDHRIRLIDTPGIGDTRGQHQDRKTLDSILLHLREYQDIHGVCIVLKPHKSRLSTMMNYCIQELLAFLPSSARDNIVFCFTHTRSTSYKVGMMLATLNALFKDKKVGIKASHHNGFCFDNETNRAILGHHKGISLTDEDIEKYSESWDRATAETDRLFGQINSMVPHKANKTVIMDEARRAIMALSRPLAVALKTIEVQMQEIKEEKHLIQTNTVDISVYEQDLPDERVDFYQAGLPLPQTVCTYTHCMDNVTAGVCHGLSYCELPENTMNVPKLQHYAFDGSMCHMHDVRKLEYSRNNTLKDIRRKTPKEEKPYSEVIMKNMNDKIKELRQEKKAMVKISAKYAAYLRTSSIVPYSDSIGYSLNLYIQEEKSKAKVVQNAKLIKRLTKLMDEYDKEKLLLTKTSSNGEMATAEDVLALRHELYNFKHFSVN